MRLVYQSFLTLTASLLILTSCSSKNNDKNKTLSPANSKPLDTAALLAYNPKNADKKIDEAMKELHRTRGFNGNVLVAKKGKIVYENAIGWADYLHRDSLKIGSQF